MTRLFTAATQHLTAVVVNIKILVKVDITQDFHSDNEIVGLIDTDKVDPAEEVELSTINMNK